MGSKTAFSHHKTAKTVFMWYPSVKFAILYDDVRGSESLISPHEAIYLSLKYFF